MDMRILLVEDEEKLATTLAHALEARGYSVDTALDGENGELFALSHSYDLIILDGMLPKKDGIEVLLTIRKKGNSTPIIMLTARDAIEDRVKGLSVGADDYIVKPFSFEELVARIRSVLRRPPLQLADILSFENLVVDTRTQQVHSNQKKIELTFREYGILEYFLRNQNTVITREVLLEHIWDRNYDGMSNVVDVHIKNLRKKLPKTYAAHIHTVWGKGYQFVS